MPTQKIDPKVIFASDAPAIDKPPVFSDKTKGWDVARANDGRPEIKQMNKMQQDTDLKILWLNENAVLPYDASIGYPAGAVAIKDGSFKQLSSGSWVEFLDDFADKDAVKRGIANRYDSSLTYNIGERVVLTNGDIVKSTVAGNTADPNVDLSTWRFDKECYYASDFAKPNTQKPQGIALQYGYAKATSEGKCFVIDDVFWVSATESNSGSPNGDRCAINVLSNSVLLFAGKGCLKVIPNNSTNYNAIIAHSGVKDYKITSPNIIGDRYSHDYSSGGSHEWGYGLCIYESSDGLIINPKISDTTGDGLYIGKAWNTQSTAVPKNITVLDPLIKNARRNGIGFTSGDTVNIVRPVVTGTSGTAPEAGIDIEPESSDRINFPPYIKNSRISNPTLIDNKIAIATPIFGDVHVDLVFDGITTIINDSSPVQISGITMSTRPKIQSDPIPSQTGSITFDHVFYKRNPTAPTYFAAIITDFTSTSLPIVFNQITCDIGSSPAYSLGVYTNPLLKKRKGVEILKFNLLGDYRFYLRCSNVSAVTFGQKIHLPDNLEVVVNSDYETLLEFTNDSYIGGFSKLAGRNGISSKYLTNNVVFDHNGGDSNYYRIVNMSNDTREHNFSVLNANLGTSQGLQLMGINYLGRTSGLSNEPAPFINIKNTANTQIKNYSLGWDFRVYHYSVPTTVVPANGSVVVDIPITYFEKNLASSKPQYTYWFQSNVNQNLFVRFEKSSSGGRLVIANTAATPVNFDSNTLYVNII